MSGQETHKQTQLLHKYLSLYERSPGSRVFAPLAETYRKLGHLDKAKEILQKGLKKHNDYVLAYIVLGNVYVDLNMYENAYEALKPFVRNNIDNLTLQKNFSDICIHLNRFGEALAVNKYLLLLNAKDEKLAALVTRLEAKCESGQEPNEDLNVQFEDDLDGWVQKSFVKDSFEDQNLSDEVDDWQMSNKLKLEDFKKQVLSNEIEVKEHSLDDEFFYEEYDNEGDDIESSDDLDPIITHTLVDLYLSQGFSEKAISVLEGILESHPSDSATIKKLESIRNLTVSNQGDESKKDLLMERVDALQSKELKILHNKFSTFLALVKNESKNAYEKNINH